MHLLVQQLGHLVGDTKQYFRPRFFAALIHSYSCHSSQQRTSNSLKTSLNSIYVAYIHPKRNISNTNTTVSFSLYPYSDAERLDTIQFYVSGLSPKKNIFWSPNKMSSEGQKPVLTQPYILCRISESTSK